MAGNTVDSAGSRGELKVGERSYAIHRLSAVSGADTLPFSLKVLLENLLRTEDGANITAEHIRAVANWDPAATPSQEIQFTPARVIMQDFTGVPCIVDLAAMREAMRDLGGDPSKINPLAPAELVIDHSVIADFFGAADSFSRNVELEYERNRERYQFLRWGQGAFDNFKVVPPGTGIVHQVNIEHLARVVFVDHEGMRLSRHARRHRQPHHDGQRAGRARLGRRRYRGRGRHARPARQHADPEGRRLQADGREPGRHHRHRPRAHRHGDAAAQGRCRLVRRVLRRGRRGRTAGQPGDDRQHEPRVRLHLRDLPDRRRDPQVPALHRPFRRAGRSGRGVRQGAGPVARPEPRGALLRDPRARPVDHRAVARRTEAPAGPGAAGGGEERLPHRLARLRRA